METTISAAIQQQISLVNQSPSSIFKTEDVLKLFFPITQACRVYEGEMQKAIADERRKNSPLQTELQIAEYEVFVKKFAKEITAKIVKMVGEMDSDDLVDYQSAEFELNYNEVSLSRIDSQVADKIDEDWIIEEIVKTYNKYFPVEEEEEEEETA